MHANVKCTKRDKTLPQKTKVLIKITEPTVRTLNVIWCIREKRKLSRLRNIMRIVWQTGPKRSRYRQTRLNIYSMNCNNCLDLSFYDLINASIKSFFVCSLSLSLFRSFSLFFFCFLLLFWFSYNFTKWTWRAQKRLNVCNFGSIHNSPFSWRILNSIKCIRGFFFSSSP